MDSKRFLVPILALLLITMSATAFYFYQKTGATTANPSVATQRETADLIATVGKLIMLPTGETPTVATVSDPAKLKGQPFFVNAKTGDKVLVYTNAKMAYLYDPSLNKLVAVAPLNIGSSSTSTMKGK